ncbi:fibronectin type III domain-containing protein [Butyrivibrio sp. AD3002]|uniref:fibronectin type III domain-containing protein n=1 Tax=Butyrivibrio sp. AD3002 TaxID=1280670 RepID=UPI0003B4A532|nr:fibronectin type III domain-containing protein [Butyrivibrio sp. AD3002]
MVKRLYLRSLSIFITPIILVSLMGHPLHSYASNTLTSSKDVEIPEELANDPVYCSMNTPSESVSDEMIRAWRDYGHIIHDDIPSSAEYLLNFGAIEETTKTTLPDQFTVYLGKMKMFAYSISQKRWITIDSQPYPTGIYIYTLPWTTTTATKCKDVTYYDNYAKVELTKKDLQGNCLHFWGRSVPLLKDDYLYYAACYDVWISGNAVGTLTASGGIDTKDSTGRNTLTQLYSSRGYSGATYKKTVWGTNIPNDEYQKCNSQMLNLLYSSDSAYSGSNTSSKSESTNKSSNANKSNGKKSNSQKSENDKKSSQKTDTETTPSNKEGTSKTPDKAADKSNDEKTTDEKTSSEIEIPGESFTEQSAATESSAESSTDVVTTPSVESNNRDASTDENNKTYYKLRAPKIKLLSAKNKSIDVKWQKSSQSISGYEVQYSTKQKISKKAKKVRIKGKKHTSTVISTLIPNTFYFIRVRSYKKIGSKTVYSKWNKQQYIKTKK